jgi:uncharacterized protein (DUF1330 family)
MPAYVVGLHRITDPEKFAEYRTKIGPMVARYGGRYLTRGENLRMPEGGYWSPERVVVTEFLNMAAIDAWYASPEYHPPDRATRGLSKRQRHDVFHGWNMSDRRG